MRIAEEILDRRECPGWLIGQRSSAEPVQHQNLDHPWGLLLPSLRPPVRDIASDTAFPNQPNDAQTLQMTPCYELQLRPGPGRRQRHAATAAVTAQVLPALLKKKLPR